MNSKCLFVNDVPFPYFILDQNLKVLEKSNQAKSIFQNSDFFSDIMDEEYYHEINHFFLASSSIDFIEIPLNEKGNQKQYYQIYKAMDESSNLHVYCIPVEKELTTVNEMLNVVDKKLFQINQDFLNKKDYMENAIKEIKAAANSVDYHNNINNLAAGIAHEIRNPLTTVKGFLQLLKPHLKEIGKAQYADVALDEINRANEIIYEFLNATKPKSNPFYGISVNKVVKDIAMLYESEAILRHIQIITTFSNKDIEVPIDSNQLKQVLSNLIKNAIEAIDENYSLERNIHISTVIDSENASIHIVDSGCGMTADTIKHLFTPFFTTKEKGTGIGLNMCKKIIEENGGTICLKSTSGNGTTFTICFPVNSASFSSLKKNA